MQLHLARALGAGEECGMAIALRSRARAWDPVDIVTEAMLAALHVRDRETCDHVRRVADLGLELTAAIAPAYARTPFLWNAFVLHDVGKLGMPDCIFEKAGPLDEAERATVETHPILGGRMVDELPFLPSVVRDVVTCHHENWDGSGYPYGLRGFEIPVAARIFSVVDAFDAMTHNRVYRSARPAEDAFAELERCAGTQFAPDVVEAFLQLEAAKRE